MVDIARLFARSIAGGIFIAGSPAQIPGTPVIGGSQVLDFYDDFCSHRATSLKADGKDILWMMMMLQPGLRNPVLAEVPSQAFSRPQLFLEILFSDDSRMTSVDFRTM
jgi:hypothetical protein